MCISLSKVYAKTNWPFEIIDSPTSEDIKDIKDFETLPLQFIDRKIGLLVGMNEPDIMEPLQIVQTKDNGPYASRHKTEWAINGPLKKISSSNGCFRTKVKEIEDIENKFESFFKSDFIETDSGKSLSPDERKWIEFVDKNCRKSDETHKYEISLPLKNKVNMPDNSSQVYNSRLKRSC